MVPSSSPRRRTIPADTDLQRALYHPFQTTAASTATFTAQEFGAGTDPARAQRSPAMRMPTPSKSILARRSQLRRFRPDRLEATWSAPKDHFPIVGAATGNDVITGTSVGDTNRGRRPGRADSIVGGAGNDPIEMGGNFDGSGLRGRRRRHQYVATQRRLFRRSSMFYSIMLQNVQKIALVAGHSYNLNIESGVVAAGKTMTIDGATLLADDNLTVDLSSAPSTRFVVDTGAGGQFNHVERNCRCRQRRQRISTFSPKTASCRRTTSSTSKAAATLS